MPEDETIIDEIVTTETPENNISFSTETNADVDVETEDFQEQEVIENEEVITPETEEIIENEEPESEYEERELDEDLAMEYLAESKGMTVEELKDSLTPKEQKKYAPEMEKFNEFIEKTGNKNYNDFLETQKDWSTESSDNVLRNYIKLSNPELTEREVNRLYDKNYNTENLDEEDDEDEILDKGINVKADLKKALSFFDQRKQEFSAVGGSDEHIPLAYREAKQLLESQKQQEEAYSIERDSSRNDFISKTESLFNSNFEGFKIKLGDEKIGFEDFSIKPDNLKEVREFQSDSNNLIKDFLDEETGLLKDPKGYHEAMYMAKNYKAEMNKAYNLGRAKELEQMDRLSKNIQPDNVRSLNNNRESGISFSRD
jgi:hypothetical protein